MKLQRLFVLSLSLFVLSTNLWAQRAYSPPDKSEEMKLDGELALHFENFTAKLKEVSAEVRDAEILHCLKTCPFRFIRDRSYRAAQVIKELTSLLTESHQSRAEAIILSRYSEFLWNAWSAEIIASGLFQNTASIRMEVSAAGRIHMLAVEMESKPLYYIDVAKAGGSRNSIKSFGAWYISGYSINERSIRVARFISKMALLEWTQFCDLDRLARSVTQMEHALFAFYAARDEKGNVYPLIDQRRSAPLMSLSFVVHPRGEDPYEVDYVSLVKYYKDRLSETQGREYLRKVKELILERHLKEYEVDREFWKNFWAKAKAVKDIEVLTQLKAAACNAKDEIIAEPETREIYEGLLNAIDQAAPTATKCTQASRTRYLGK